MVENGTIVQTHTTEAKAQLEETDEEILAFTIARLRDRFNSTAPEIILPFPVEYPQEGIVITVPKGRRQKETAGTLRKKCELLPRRSGKEENASSAKENAGGKIAMF